MKNMKKSVALVLALVLMVGVVVGGTIAWLTDTTEEIKNTFTVGNIDIDLTETTGDEYKMIPGETLAKNPTVTVEAGSEECWLFVKIEEENDLADFIAYTVAEGWTELEAGVYWREAVAGDEFSVLADNEVTVKADVTKEMMDGLAENPLPTLTFTAYAVQKAGNATAAEAWAKI